MPVHTLLASVIVAPEMLLAWRAAILVTSDLVNGVLGLSLCVIACKLNFNGLRISITYVAL